MTTWNDNTKRLESFMGVHQTTVTSISWSSNGTRLITGDAVSSCSHHLFELKLNRF